MEIKNKIPLIFGVPDASFYDLLKEKEVFVAELRPDLDGIKIVARALLKRGIHPVVVCDNMVAFCMQRGLVSDAHIFHQEDDQEILLCRTGSFTVALCAREHDVPLHLHTAKISLKKTTSLTCMAGKRVTTKDIKTYVPFFEEVPRSLIQAHLTVDYQKGKYGTIC